MYKIVTYLTGTTQILPRFTPNISPQSTRPQIAAAAHRLNERRLQTGCEAGRG